MSVCTYICYVMTCVLPKDILCLQQPPEANTLYLNIHIYIYTYIYIYIYNYDF